MYNKTLKIGECIKTAWSGITSRIGFWAGLVGITILALMIPYLIGFGAGALDAAAAGADTVQRTLTGEQVQMRLDASAIGAGIGLVLAIAIGVFISLGWTNVALKFAYGEHYSWGDFFKPVRHGKMFFSYLASTVLFALIVAGGTLLFVFPGVIWMLMFSMYPYYVVRHKMGPIMALRASAKTTFGAKWDLLGLWAVLLVLHTAGAAVFYIGLLVVYVLNALAQAHAFKELYAQSELPPELAIPAEEVA